MTATDLSSAQAPAPAPAKTRAVAPSRRALPLERTLPLLVLGLFSLVLAISLAASYYEVRHSAMQLAAERLTSLSKVLTTYLQQQTATRIGLMHRLARDSAIQNSLKSPDRPASLAARQTLATLMSSRNDSLVPRLWTTEGRPVGQPLRLELPADQQQLRDALHHLATSNDSFYVSPLQPHAGRTVYWQAVSVRENATNRLMGFIVQERIVNGNPRSLQPLRDLVGSDIDFYYRNTNGPTWVQPTGATVAPPIKSERYAGSVYLFTHGATGKMLGATEAVHGTPFAITVERSVDAVLARPSAMMRVLIALGIVLAVGGAIVVWILSRQLVRPLGELTSAAEGIAHGRYAERVKVRGGDEIRRLGAAFNRMAVEVEVASDASERAVANLTKLAEDQRFLAQASGILAGSLSDETMLGDLARYCVPRIADYCTIHIVGENGAIRRIETVHANPERQQTVRALVRRYEYRLDTPSEVATVIRTQKPALRPDIDLVALKRHAPDETTAELLDAVRPHSYLCVPLVARGRAFGAISFTMAESERKFSTSDLEIATELAQRTSAAIDNAVIYRRSLELRLEAEAASSAKSDFLAKMSHEIRTPINAMMGYAELIQMGIAGPVNDVQAKHLSRIRASGDHLTALVSEILDLAKIEAGRMGVQPTVAIAGDAVEAALTMIRPLAHAKGVELSSTIGGKIDAEYFGDPQRVQQILTNLLSNAVKFTPAGGRVAVSCDVGPRDDASVDGDEEWTHVSVTDTGVGIAAADTDRIFHPFVQADAGYTRVHGGTGLGLAISRSLAQMMGGDITVESEPGKGSRFSLWLPCPIRAIAAS
jgi:signal transduction histidine kinase